MDSQNSKKWGILNSLIVLQLVTMSMKQVIWRFLIINQHEQKPYLVKLALFPVKMTLNTAVKAIFEMK